MLGLVPFTLSLAPPTLTSITLPPAVATAVAAVAEGVPRLPETVDALVAAAAAQDVDAAVTALQANPGGSAPAAAALVFLLNKIFDGALLPPKEAAALVRRCDRSVGALTYGAVRVRTNHCNGPPYASPACVCGAGWLSPGDPDPAGQRLQVVRRALAQNPHIKGLFWECAHAQSNRVRHRAAETPRLPCSTAMRRCTSTHREADGPTRKMRFSGVR